VTCATAWLTVESSTGDYRRDAGPAIDALVRGHVLRAIQLQPLMGSLSLVLRAPFALAAHLGGYGETAVYRAGVLPCLAAPAAVGVAIAVRRTSVGLIVPLLAVLTPASLAAVRTGHPEEALGAALVVAAVLLAGERAVWAGLALGLAVATKQWAVVAIPPVIWLVPRPQRLRALLAAVAIAALLTLPLALGSRSAFFDTSHNAATAPAATARATVWYLAAHHRTLPVHAADAASATVQVSTLPGWTARVSHPLIVLVAPLLLLLVRRRRPTAADALALLSLALLLRCVLDSVNNEYYHLPFLLALLAYETVSRRDFRGLPLATLFSCAGLWLTFDTLDAQAAVRPAVTNAVYLAWTAAIAIYLVHAVRRRTA
jgi:hypothetical protein